MTHRVLILGASGQAGPILAKNLLQRGFHVGCTSRLEPPKGLVGLRKLRIIDKVKKLCINPTNFKDLLHLIEDFRPTIIFHFAGAASPGQSNRNPTQGLDFAKTTLNLLEAIRRLSCKTVIRIASSGDILKKKKDQL